MWAPMGQVAQGWVWWGVGSVSFGEQKLLTGAGLGDDPSARIGDEASAEVGPVVL